MIPSAHPHAPARAGRRIRRHVARQPRHDDLPPPVAVAPSADAAPSRGAGVPVHHLDHDRHPAPPVGRRAPQAPRVHGRRGRPALARAARVGQGADDERGDVPPRGPQPPDPLAVRQGPPPDVADRWFYDHALLGLAIGVAVLVITFGWQIGLLAAFVHVNLYLGGSAAVNAIAHHFGRKPYDNTRRQPAVAGLPHRRRGPAQQPPRPADIGQAGPPLVRDRPGLVRDQGADLGATGQDAGGGAWPASPVRSRANAPPDPAVPAFVRRPSPGRRSSHKRRRLSRGRRRATSS